MALTPLQKSIALGILLSSSQPSSGFLRVEHSLKQWDYVEWKYLQLRPYVAQPIEVVKDRGLWVCRFVTRRHSYFYNVSRRLFRKDGKRLSSWILDRLTFVSLVIWLLDRGKYNPKRRTIQWILDLSVPEEDVMKLSLLLLERWSLRNDPYPDKRNNCWRIRCRYKGSRAFLRRVKRLNLPEDAFLQLGLNF